jgi:hypothetical protein
MNEQNLKKKLTVMIATVVLLSLGLAITSFALASSIVSIRNNRFSMDMSVELMVNDGNPVVNVANMVYEPGGTYTSEFPITNLGTLDVWYRVYLTGVNGELRDDIIVTIKEEDGTVLCKGAMNQLTADKVMKGSLAAGESKTLTIEFYFSSDADNSAQGQTVSFNIMADATQKKNNPDKDFGN